MKCFNCGKETKNPKFCSRNCAASYNNSRRKKKKYYCIKCGKYIYTGFNTSQRKLCDDCNPSIIDWSKYTYGDLLKRRKYQAHSHIRELARKTYDKSNKPKYCANCGYNKHFEVCHIYPIEKHNLDTPISVINDIHNLIGLCPNCHWELDNGLLECKKEWK